MKRNDLAGNPSGGKGDSPRPFNVSVEDYSKKWADIFGKKVESSEKSELRSCGNCLKCKCETKEKV